MSSIRTICVLTGVSGLAIQVRHITLFVSSQSSDGATAGTCSEYSRTRARQFPLIGRAQKRDPARRTLPRSRRSRPPPRDARRRLLAAAWEVGEEALERVQAGQWLGLALVERDVDEGDPVVELEGRVVQALGARLRGLGVDVADELQVLLHAVGLHPVAGDDSDHLQLLIPSSAGSSGSVGLAV